MGLEIPELDDREYAEILEDARKLIPVHSDEWTDHNVHDPGITILETLAWLAETYIYQLDRVTDAHRRKYLKLMGVRPRPPIPATANLRLRAPEGRQGDEIPEGEAVTVDDGSGFTGVFETTKPVTLTRARIERVVTVHPAGRTDNSTANETYGMQFLAFGERAVRGSTMYLGFDSDPFVAAVENIVDVTVDFHDDGLPEIVPHEADDPEFRPSVGVSWQYCTDYDDWTSDSAWEEFRVRRDQTKKLYQGGTVALEKTEGWTGEKGRILDQDDRFVWIRCTVEEPGYEIPPPLNSVRMDVVPVRHESRIADEELRRPDGGTETTARPGQTFVFERSPVLEAEIAVGDERWEEVADFDASGPDDTHYVIDSSREAIRFGNGVGGKVPEAGQTVVAETYVYGGGEGGNVPRSSSCRFERAEFSDIAVSLEDKAEGGADAESVEAALRRLREDLETPYQTVTFEDYRHVAIHTPGLRFGRAQALMERGEDTARNEVRVVVVPYSPLARARPSRGFLDVVRRHVEKHRLLTDRVTVEAPTYVGISVRAELRIAPEHAAEGRTTEVETALDGFLDPLDGYDGDGWPFGRPVYKSELYEVIEGIEGVDVVFDVSISARGEATTDVNGNVRFGDSALPYPRDHTVIVKRDPQGGRP
jgi:predicted phage baseplate assembly protein